MLFVAHIQGCYNFLGLSCLALFECSYIGHLQFCTNKIKDAIANENKEQYQKGKWELRNKHFEWGNCQLKQIPVTKLQLVLGLYLINPLTPISD